MLKIINPYPGFENGFYRPYIENEHSLFFGRDRDISTLKLKVRQRRLVSLVADEKMGKTSLLRAGLIPNLRNNPFDGYTSNKWKCVYMMPENRPIHALAKALVNPQNKLSDKIKPSMEEEVYQQLKKNDYGLVRVAESIIGDRNINILLVVDDFIDVFNSEIEDKERLQFLRLIHKVYLDKNLPFFVVTSFNKTDFKDNRLRREPKLHKALNMGVHKMKFLSDTGLQKAIDEPAKLANSLVANDLSKEMMLMLLQDNDQLRKLQLLMSRTWYEWKRNHKDKTITKAHYFRATGQKSKAVAKGLMKGGKISVDHLESLAKQSAKADNVEMAKADYDKLSNDHKALFKRLIPHLIDDEGKNLKAVSIERKKAGEMLGLTMEELGVLVTQIPTILAMDKKKISVNEISVFENWDEIKEWIRNNNALKLKFEQICEAAILHYIDGIDLPSVISRQQYKEQFKYVDFDLISHSWAKAQHKHFELGLDFIEKLQETYGILEVQNKKKSVKKKMSIGVKSSDSKPDESPMKASAESDEDARLEALKILQGEESIDSKGQEKEEVGQAQKEETNLPSEPAGEVDEDEAIRRLLDGEDSHEKEDQNELEETKEEIVDIKPKKIALKSKGKIVLKAKGEKENVPKEEKPSSKPKIVIKKK